MTLWRRGLTLLLLVLLAVGAGSAATPVARIDVLDASIRPVETRVDVGGHVVWTNRGPTHPRRDEPAQAVAAPHDPSGPLPSDPAEARSERL